MLGYSVSKYLDFEAGYTSLARDVPVPLNSILLFSASTDGFEVATAVNWPINEKFQLFYRLGYAMTTSNIKTSYSSRYCLNTVNGNCITYTTTNGNLNAAGNFNGMVYGPGVKYSLTKGFDLRLGYNTYNFSGRYNSQLSESSANSNGQTYSSYQSSSSANSSQIFNNLYVSGAYNF
jgi:hypothetical protein